MTMKAPAAKVRLRVQPRASKSELVGEVEGVWRVRLTAPPVDGAANQACIEFLADCLGLKKNQVRLVSGEKSREKIIEAEGLSEEEANQRLSARSSKADHREG
jgi:uncharacterized protein (TIGR00251 family)